MGPLIKDADQPYLERRAIEYIREAGVNCNNHKVYEQKLNNAIQLLYIARMMNEDNDAEHQQMQIRKIEARKKKTAKELEDQLFHDSDKNMMLREAEASLKIDEGDFRTRLVE